MLWQAHSDERRYALAIRELEERVADLIENGDSDFNQDDPEFVARVETILRNWDADGQAITDDVLLRHSGTHE